MILVVKTSNGSCNVVKHSDPHPLKISILWIVISTLHNKMDDFRSIHTKRNAVPTSVGETAAKQDGGQNRCRQDSLQLLILAHLCIVLNC